MGVTLLALYKGQPGTSNTTLYTAPANTRVHILAASAVNDSTTATYFSVHMVPSGQAVGDEYLVVNRETLGSRESAPIVELQGHVLEAGDFLSAIAETADTITLQISGVSIA